MRLPTSRGPLGSAVFHALTHDVASLREIGPSSSGTTHDDEALTLWALHELSYRGFDDVDDDLEWDADVLRVRRMLERRLEARLRERWDAASAPGDDGRDGDVGDALFAFVEAFDGPSVARHLQSHADVEQARDFLRVKSIYHLKESDPVSWLLPRLSARPKAALAEIQYDEYGAGDPNRLHHQLFARGLQASGLDPTYGTYIDETPVEVLEQNNAVSLFGLHRRLRAAAAGHLAAFEATSSVPSRRIAQGLRRLGLPEEIVGYYTEHVTADAVHDQLAVRAICAAMVEEEPTLYDDVLFGAFTCMDLERRFAQTWLATWAEAAA
ncbi:iron-containing redox enzyme family protein [Nocardioides sp. R-C-SC26]|uniref:iron-containing redox enzyme family protein n=1 Tax=Nocardioides sp. R-C-SC26 TaxID=2870414 RepID=UPI001E647121|nr:iron-containing redox enzyme family protein [Nocardioides sp. R-C-SC26]